MLAQMASMGFLVQDSLHVSADSHLMKYKSALHMSLHRGLTELCGNQMSVCCSTLIPGILNQPQQSLDHRVLRTIVLATVTILQIAKLARIADCSADLFTGCFQNAELF